MATLHRIRPIIGLDKENVPKLIIGSQVIHDDWNENVGALGTPSIPLATLQTQITAVTTANQAVKTDKKAAPARTVQVNVLWGTLEAYLQFLQALCDAHPDQASAFIASSGFKESAVGEKQFMVLTAEPTTVAGQVLLTIHSAFLQTPKNKPYAKRTHLIQHSLDGGKTFVGDEPTSESKALISGLPAMVPLQFQIAAKDSSGTSAWCAPVPITLLK
jgi:hypothetical protein